MYVAGIINNQDIYDDVTKIPVWGDLRNSDRYNHVEPVLRENPDIDTLVGHNLGGAVVLELQRTSPTEI